jgi:NAD(P)-dependent dehydrogenase (short-subunit alcohol dehydrogenase family)
LCSTDGPTESWRKIFDLNVLGLSMCTKEALQSMKERGVDDGHVIHINRRVRQSRQPREYNELVDRSTGIAALTEIPERKHYASCLAIGMYS